MKILKLVVGIAKFFNSTYYMKKLVILSIGELDIKNIETNKKPEYMMECTCSFYT